MNNDLPLHDPMIQDALMAEAALARAQKARQNGDLGLALEHARQAWATAPVDGMRASAGWLACFCHFRLGQMPALCKRGEAVLPLLHEPIARMNLMRWLCLAHAEGGAIETARRHGLSALNLADAQGDEAERARVRQALARTDLLAGDPAGAESRLHEAVGLAEAQPQAWPLLSSLADLAEAGLDAHHCAALRGEAARDEARQALERSVEAAMRGQAITRRLGDSHYHTLLDGWLGEALLHQGQSAAATTRLHSALCEALSHNLSAQAERLQVTLAEAEFRRGDAGAAQERLDQLLDTVAANRAEAQSAPQPAARHHAHAASTATAQIHPGLAALPPVTAWRVERLALKLVESLAPDTPAAQLAVRRSRIDALATRLCVAQGLDVPAR